MHKSVKYALIAMHIVVSLYASIVFMHAVIVTHGWLAFIALSAMPIITAYMAYKAFTTSEVPDVQEV